KEFKKPKGEWSVEEINLVREKVVEIAKSNFFGFDINPDLIKATKMNMVMNNDGSGNILQNNSLNPPHEWAHEFKNQLAIALDVNIKDIRNCDSIGFFDVIVTNPPFGSKIPIKDSQILEQFDLGYIWEKDKLTKRWIKTSRLHTKLHSENEVFIYRELDC
ncbi:MAG: N-6 DNA methylase, partial [Nitrospirae bacterium]|nr:N-6 DNA methylase [Nitrospirota bacterium]